jgi:hypothetical protein
VRSYREHQLNFDPNMGGIGVGSSVKMLRPYPAPTLIAPPTGHGERVAADVVPPPSGDLMVHFTDQ